MSEEERTRWSVFLDVHHGLPRQAPGDRASTLGALALAGIDSDVRVLDIACGPGMQTLDLARALPQARIDAIDAYPPFVEEARARIEAADLSHRITVSRADMRALPFARETFDVVWCEGAAYIMGVANALSAWRPLLKRAGVLAFTEVVWLRDDVPPALASWWHENYPGMGSADDCRAAVTAAGLRVLGDFVLQETAWWQDYYDPLARRLDALREVYAGDAVAESVLDSCRLEIENYRKHADCYGYLFVVARKAREA